MADPVASLWLLSEFKQPEQRMEVNAPTTPPIIGRFAKPTNKILFLDGLRGLAAMLVVSEHVGYFEGHNMGAPAVDAFFVLSAFLLTMIFEKKARQLVQQNASPRRWLLALSDYFARRFLRVYPLFAIVAIVLAVLPASERKRSLLMKQPEKYNLLKVLLFYPKSHPHVLWSLPVEISYYFFIPVFAVLSVCLEKRWWMLAVVGYACVFYNGLFEWNIRRQHGLRVAHYPTLLCGSLGAMIFVKMDAAIKRSRVTWTTSRIYVLRTFQTVFVVLLLSNLFNGLLFNWIAKNPIPDSNHFVSFPITVLIVSEMLQPGPISSVLEWSLLRFAGKVSFSMYLLHIFVVYADFVKRSPYYDRFFVMWTLVFLLSTASYHAVELPCQRAAARVGKWIKEKDNAAAALDVVSRSAKPDLESNHEARSS